MNIEQGKLPFEQQPKESAKAFAAFREYLELGPKRSLAAVGQKLGKSKVLIERWASKFDWTARIRAHGAYLAGIERTKIEELVSDKAVEWHKAHDAVKREAWRKADELMALADKFIEQWGKSARPPGFESVVRGIELAIKLKQFAAGMPSEIKEVNTNFTAKLEVEWEVALRKAYGKPDVQIVDVEAKPALKEGE